MAVASSDYKYLHGRPLLFYDRRSDMEILASDGDSGLAGVATRDGVRAKVPRVAKGLRFIRLKSTLTTALGFATSRIRYLRYEDSQHATQYRLRYMEQLRVTSPSWT